MSIIKHYKTKETKSIAFITWFFPKLSETFVLNQIVHLKKIGYHVQIFAVKNPQKELAMEDYRFERVVHTDVNKHRLLDITRYGLPEDIFVLLNQRIKRKKIDIVYFQFPDLAAELLKYGELKCPTISVFHDIPKSFGKKDFESLRKKYEIVFRNVTMILAISEFTKKELINLGCSKFKILVHHMGVDTEIFRPPKVEIPLSPFRFIMIGRFVEKKGFLYGIKAFHRVLKKHPNRQIKLLIIGDGILNNVLYQEVKRLKLEEDVVFFGKLPQQKVIKLLQVSHCLVCPSITTHKGEREGLPVVIMEAAACGLPVIGTNHTAIPEILRGNQKMLVKEKSVQDLAGTMERVLKNYRNIRNTLGKRNRQLVVQEYNIRKLIKRLLDIFELTEEIYRYKTSLKKFSQYIAKHLSDEISSVLLVGSIARHEVLTRESDVDLIVVFKYKNFIPFDALLRLNKAITLLKKSSKLRIVPQIFTRFDLFQLLSPVLIKSYIEDGEVIYGEDLVRNFKDRLSRFSEFQYEIALVRRCLFERYFLREYLANSFQKQGYSLYRRLAKTVLFLSRDFLYLSKKIVITKRDEIAENFFTEYKNRIPIIASKIISSKRYFKKFSANKRKIFAIQAIDFVENICDKIVKLIKNKYPNKKIYIFPF